MKTQTLKEFYCDFFGVNEFNPENTTINRSVIEFAKAVLNKQPAIPSQISQIEGLKYDGTVSTYSGNYMIDKVLEILRQAPPVIQAKCNWEKVGERFETSCNNVAFLDHTRTTIKYEPMQHCPFCGKEIEREQP